MPMPVLPAITAGIQPPLGVTDTTQPSASAASTLVVPRRKCRSNSAIAVGLVGLHWAGAVSPDADFTVWIGTNPATRKVADLARDPRATVQFFEPNLPAYVTFTGSASLVTDPEVKAVHFKEEWGPFYKDRFRGHDFALLKFVPQRLEIVSQSHGLVNDPKTWRPVTIELAGAPSP